MARHQTRLIGAFALRLLLGSPMLFLCLLLAGLSEQVTSHTFWPYAAGFVVVLGIHAMAETFTVPRVASESEGWRMAVSLAALGLVVAFVVVFGVTPWVYILIVGIQLAQLPLRVWRSESRLEHPSK